MGKVLQSKADCGRLQVDESGWLICPYCHRWKLLRIWPETQAKNLQVFCRSCRREIIVDINQGECLKGHGL